MTDNKLAFLSELEQIVDSRLAQDDDRSYTAQLAAAGLSRVAQKVGEEAVELALAAATEDAASVRAEAADLLFHFLVLLRVRGIALADVVTELESRHAARS